MRRGALVGGFAPAESRGRGPCGTDLGRRDVRDRVAEGGHVDVAIKHFGALCMRNVAAAGDRLRERYERHEREPHRGSLPLNPEAVSTCRGCILRSGHGWWSRANRGTLRRTMSRALNFNAGPASLPLAALERARAELVDFEGSGMSIMEHSHRGKVYEKVHHEAMALVAKHLGLSAAWDVLFVQGGASMAFAQLPMNFLEKGQTADYVVTGAWGEKAVSEARACASLGCGEVHVACSTEKDNNYTRVPQQEELELTSGAAYLHCTSNETIHGVEYARDPSTPFPKTDAPVFVDMSSDILGRRVDASQFELIYGGAQKNIGPSGVTIVCLKKDLTARGRKDLPAIVQYRTHADNQSLFNTPATFGIYLVRNTLMWLEAEGGVPAMEARNEKKAALIYDAIEATGGFYRCPVDKRCRSMMNVVWRLPTSELEAAFVKEAEAHRMMGLKGHRSVGGIRASLYNAVELEWVATLASFMKEFARKNG